MRLGLGGLCGVFCAARHTHPAIQMNNANKYLPKNLAARRSDTQFLSTLGIKESKRAHFSGHSTAVSRNRLLAAHL